MTETLNRQNQEESVPEYKEFEGIKIQWNKIPWKFNHPELGRVAIDTYSIWNSAHHPEIADRLLRGERCVLYMMGTFGVGQLFKPGGIDHQILDSIKQRERTQNLVVFAHPDDIESYIDFERLPQEHKKLADRNQRRRIYPGPLHAIFPAKRERMPSLDLLRAIDQTVAFFWIPGHWGYESLVAEMKKRISGGLFGGGSLNIHGQEPSFSTSDLRDREMVRHLEWLENIDFVIIDEIGETADIGRSHTQVSFVKHPAEVVRHGSLSIGEIAREMDFDLTTAEGARNASSKTPYDNDNNEASDRKVKETLSKINRFGKELQGLT